MMMLPYKKQSWVSERVTCSLAAIPLSGLWVRAAGAQWHPRLGGGIWVDEGGVIPSQSTPRLAFVAWLSSHRFPPTYFTLHPKRD
jgi:hypothetical protein